MKCICQLALGVGLVLGLGLPASAQMSIQTEDGKELVKQEFRPRVWVGGHFALQRSKFNFLPRVSQSLHPGYSTGLLARVDVERGASIQIEVNYNRSGWTERYEDKTLSYKRNLTSIEVPLLTHLYLTHRGMRFYLNVGPIGSWVLEEQGESTAGKQEKFAEAALHRHGLPVKNRFVWGLGGGPGISIPLARRHRVELEGRFFHSLTDIWGNKRTDAYGSSTEMRFSVGVNYIFGL